MLFSPPGINPFTGPRGQKSGNKTGTLFPGPGLRKIRGSGMLKKQDLGEKTSLLPSLSQRNISQTPLHPVLGEG